jgi:hypothetical protein
MKTFNFWMVAILALAIGGLIWWVTMELAWWFATHQP